MSRRNKDRHSGSNSSSYSSDPFYAPFEKLKEKFLSGKKQARNIAIKTISEPQAQAYCKPPEPSDEMLFAEAMKDVAPLKKNEDEPERIPPPRPTDRAPQYFAISELEAYNELLELTSGNTTFDLYYSDEYVEGAVQGVSSQILRKLRRGEFSYQDYLDLHGYTKREAQQKVIAFVERAYLRGDRCVLIIPGRGLNSADKKPVLKEGLIRWLTQYPLKNIVLAFSSARSCDGGLGAFYVLLRRVKQKGRFSIRNFPLV
ncbi:MAG: Smr/MutS family protein [Thermodesulforhabdaceae bacterium]